MPKTQMYLWNVLVALAYIQIASVIFHAAHWETFDIVAFGLVIAFSSMNEKDNINNRC